MLFRPILNAFVAAAAVSAQTAPQPDGWPQFKYGGIITNKDTAIYNPTNEFIFPSMFHAGRHLSEPLAEWYVYYAPHENPGGVSLMYADNLSGPWIEFSGNPIIENDTEDYSVPHVSSPEAVFNAQESGKMFLYFHGGNDRTRWAENSSGDGTQFTYGGIALENSMTGPGNTETSYARVFPHPNVDSSYRYASFFMGNEQNTRRIRLAESGDGRSWTVSPDIVVFPGPEEEGNVSSADLWQWNGQHYVIYHASSGNIYARTIDRTLRNVGTTPILLHTSSGEGEDVGRVASPQVVTRAGETYLFYEAGDRLGATIAWAKAE